MNPIISAEEARKLLDAYRAPGADRPLTLNNPDDVAMFRAAPRLAAAVIALTIERDSERANGDDLADAVVALTEERDRLRADAAKATP